MRGLRRRLNATIVGTLVVGLIVWPAVAYGASGDGSAAETGTSEQPVTQRLDDPAEIARAYVAENAADLGVARADVSDMQVATSYRSAHSGVTHVNLNQRYKGLEVFGAYATVNVASDGQVVFVGDSLVSGLAADAAAPDLEAVDAVEAAAEELDLDRPSLRVLTRRAGPAEETVVSSGGISDEPIPARLGWQPTDDGLRLAWQLVIDDATEPHLWNATVDAETGEVLQVDDWTSQDSPAALAGTLARPLAHPKGSSSTALSLVSAPEPVEDGSSYRVFAHPAESPNDGDRTLVTAPADGIGSPFGWHDTDGASGPEFTITRGNNVHAYLDQDSDNAPDFGDTDGGPGLDFDFPLDLDEHAQSYRDAATTNLFYWNNIVHDVMYRYGFDEAAGNFQANNYGRGGTAGDYVRAEAADGSGTNNANFATPVETPTSGGTPRMQMFPGDLSGFDVANQVVVDGVGSFDASWSRFGAAPSAAGASGQFYDAGNGCAAADYADNPGGDWIAIVTGFNAGCQDADKARQAGAAGASAIVVAAGINPVILTGPLTTAVPDITVASINGADGDAIRAAIASGSVTGTVRQHPDHPGIRDGDLESGIIIHEYGHGVSNRLTGGPTVNCLFGNESMSEGWSDYLAVAMLLDPAVDDPQGPRGTGSYALFQACRQDPGIRPAPYSRNMQIQPATYDSIKNAGWLEAEGLSVPHGIGHVWAAMLWDMTWDLIDEHGFNSDVYGAWDSGGNNLAIQLVIDGLKMQGCSPGFVDGRDAIIAADQVLTGGANACTLWASFARRGLGYSATQGSSFDRNDNSEAFDTHPDCARGFAGGVADPPEINDVRAGANVPLVFGLGGDEGLDIFASGSPYSRQVDCDTLRTIDPESRTITPRPLPVALQTPGRSGLSYDPAEDRYTYPWKTLKQWANTCREVVFTLSDGVQHRAYFRFVPLEPPAPSPVLQSWEARYDGPGNDSDFVRAAVQSPDGSRVFVTGQSIGDGTGVDYATVAYDTSTGDELWSSRYNGPIGNGSDVAWAVAVSPDGSQVFVTGSSVGDGTITDYATVAYAAETGEQLWVARSTGPGNGLDIARGVTVSPDSARVYVTGQQLGEGTSLDFATVAYDAATGEELWLARYNGPFPRGTATDIPGSVAVTPDGTRVLVTGRSSGVASGDDYATVAYNASDGTQEWVARYNGPGNRTDEPHAMSVSPDGGQVFVTGQSLGTDNFLPDYATVAYDTTDGAELWVARYDGAGNGSDVARAIAVAPDGERVIVTGGSFAGDDAGLDYATVAYDMTDGAEVWRAQYDGPARSTDSAWSLDVSRDGSRVVVTGQSLDVGTISADYATVSYDAQDGAEQWAVRYDGPGMGIDIPRWVGLSPDGRRVVVTGESEGQDTRADYATVGYEIVPLEE